MDHAIDIEQTQALPVACTLSAPEQAARQQVIQAEIARGREAVVELTDGYALRYPGDGAWATKLLEFITFERQCCQFFIFELVFEPACGPVWLRLRGGEGVKEFTRHLTNL